MNMKAWNFSQSLYSKRFSSISNKQSYKLLRRSQQFKMFIKKYKGQMRQKLPMNMKLVQISPMTKVMMAMLGSVLAMGEYLDKAY